MKQTALLFCCTILSIAHSYSQTLTKKEIAQINSSANAYLSLIAEYSNCDSINNINLYADILASKDGTDETELICNDLFPEITGNYDDNLEWGEYLLCVQNVFNFKINVANENSKLLSCQLSTNGNRYALYEVDKTLNYSTKKEGKTISLNSTQKIILVINLKNFLIKEIVSPSFFSKHNNACNVTDVDDEQLKNLRIKGEQLFKQQNFKDALPIYTILVGKDSTDLLAKTRYDDCIEKVSYLDLKEKADSNFRSKNFEVAENEYGQILNEYEEADKDLLKQKIIQCKEGTIELNFEKNVQLGDYYYSVANFEKARNYYTDALKIMPDDASTIQKLENSKHGDKSYVLSEIQRANHLAERRKGYYGKAFKILTTYEQSGQLTTQNYMFLTYVLDKKYHSIRKEMKYSYSNFQNYLAIYSNKLIENINSPNVDASLREKAIRLYNGINDRHKHINT